MDHLTKIMSAIKEKEVVLFNSPLYRNPYDDGEDCLPPLGLGYILTHLIPWLQNSVGAQSVIPMTSP